MSEPIRYTGKTEGCLLGSPHWEHPKGEWVKWEDYASLKDKNARLQAEVERLTWLQVETLNERNKAEAEVERLRKAGDAMARIIAPPTHGTGEWDGEWEAWNAAKEGKPSV